MYRVIFFFFLCLNIKANSLFIEFGHFKYRVQYDMQILHLTGNGIDLKFNSKTCNKEIIERTVNRIQNQLKYPFVPVFPKNGLRITKDREVYFEESDTKRGIFFLGLPSLFKQLVIEEQLLCKK